MQQHDGQLYQQHARSENNANRRRQSRRAADAPLEHFEHLKLPNADCVDAKSHEQIDRGGDLRATKLVTADRRRFRLAVVAHAFAPPAARLAAYRSRRFPTAACIQQIAVRSRQLAAEYRRLAAFRLQHSERRLARLRVVQRPADAALGVLVRRRRSARRLVCRQFAAQRRELVRRSGAHSSSDVLVDAAVATAATVAAAAAAAASTATASAAAATVAATLVTRRRHSAATLAARRHDEQPAADARRATRLHDYNRDAATATAAAATSGGSIATATTAAAATATATTAAACALRGCCRRIKRRRHASRYNVGADRHTSPHAERQRR